MTAWVIGNWKQNPATLAEAKTLATELSTIAASADLTHCQLMVIPSLVHISVVADKLHGSALTVGAQDISAYSATTGAYTGDCSALQVKNAGATWVLVGHSERRQYHGEGQTTLQQKLTLALESDLGAIFCIGETEEQYERGQTLSVIEDQLQVIEQVVANSKVASQAMTERLIVAYEPVWAIGTGKVPTSEEVSATHHHIKQVLAGIDQSLCAVKVLYGGSVNADNADQFAAAKDVDGALVGGASLKAESFLTIVNAFAQP